MHLKRSNLIFGPLLIASLGVVLFSTGSIAQSDDLTSSPAPTELFAAAPKVRVVATKARRVRRSAEPAVKKTIASAPAIRRVLDQPGIDERHKRIAEETLRTMPVQCQATLKNFYVRYDNPSQRGLAGKSTMILSGNVPDDEFRALFAHEFGHMMDLGCLEGTSQSGPSAFKDGSETIYLDDASVRFYEISWSDAKTKKPGSASQDFVSGYAQWDAFEDLAETVAAYVLHKDALKQLAEKNAAIAAKVQWIETELFPGDTTVATSSFSWGPKHPWDITKLSYSWIASLQW